MTNIAAVLDAIQRGGLRGVLEDMAVDNNRLCQAVAYRCEDVFSALNGGAECAGTCEGCPLDTDEGAEEWLWAEVE